MERNTVGVIQDFGPHVRWIIPDFFVSSAKSCIYYKSPYIQYEDSGFTLYLNNYGGTPKSMSQLELERVPKNATFTLGIETKDGREYEREIGSTCTKTTDSCLLSNISGIDIEYFEQSFYFSEDIHNKRQDNSLTVYCNLRSKEIVTDAVQSITNKESIERSPQNLKTLLLGSDVTFNVKGRQIRANREILEANSPVFCAMFQHDYVERRNGVVDIDDCEPDIFLDFFAFLYSGRIDDEMPKGNAVGLYTTADKYDVKQLKDECVQFMIKEISVDTFCDFTSLALRYNESTLLRASTKFFKENPKTVTLTPQWKTFLKENLDAANELMMQVFEIFIK